MSVDATAEFGIGATPARRDRSVVGVDLGVKRLLVAAPANAGPDVANALVVEGGVERDLYDGLRDTLTRLDRLPGDTHEAESWTVDAYRRLLRQRFALASCALSEYVDRVGADVVALEDTVPSGGTLVECVHGRTKAGGWVLPTLRDRLEATLPLEGYQVERVDARCTTQRCHVCGEQADVGRATIACPTEACPVERVDRDASAAVSIAKRTRIE